MRLAALATTLIVCASAQAAAPWGEEAEREYQRALSLNRQGLGLQALAVLDALIERYPDVVRLRLDALAVASASGLHERVVAQADQPWMRQAPPYVQQALANSRQALVALAAQAQARARAREEEAAREQRAAAQQRHDRSVPWLVAESRLGFDADAGRSGRDAQWDLRAYAPLSAWESGAARGLRPFVRQRLSSASGTADAKANDSGVGLQWRRADMRWEAELGQAGYARLEGDATWNSQWSWGALWEQGSTFIPVRALVQGQTGRVLQLSTRWQAHHNTSVRLGWSAQAVAAPTATNHRHQLNALAETQLIAASEQRPWQLTGSLWWSHQRNSAPQAVAFFAPTRLSEASVSLEAALRSEGSSTGLARWSRVWLTAGTVDQQGFGRQAMQSAAIGQSLPWRGAGGARWWLTWRLGTTRYPFDGRQEGFNTLSLRLEGQP